MSPKTRHFSHQLHKEKSSLSKGKYCENNRYVISILVKYNILCGWCNAKLANPTQIGLFSYKFWLAMKKYPNIVRKIAAIAYDTLVICVIEIVLTAVILAFRQGELITPSTHWYQLLLLLSMCCYISLSWRFGGQTIGMKAWHIRLVSSNTNPLSWYQIIARLILFLPACLSSPILMMRPKNLLFLWTKTTICNAQSN